MPYNTPFKYLEPLAVRYLYDPDNLDVNIDYVDSLAMLHDALISFSSNPMPSRFDDINDVKDNLEEAVASLKISYRQLQNSILLDISKNVTDNRETALDLYNEFFSSSRKVTTYNARRLVDSFLDDLLEQYRILRYPNVFIP